MTPEEIAAQQASIKAETAVDANGNPIPKGESLLSTIIKAGISGVATNMFVGVGVEAFMNKPAAAGVTNSAAGQSATSAKSSAINQTPQKPATRGEIIKGPAEGGGFANRPIMGGLAEQAATNPAQVDYGNPGKVDAVTDGAQKGFMNINGYDLNIAKYLPGADFVSSAAGSLEATDAAAMLTQTVLREAKPKDEDQELVDKIMNHKKPKEKRGLNDEQARKFGHLKKEAGEKEADKKSENNKKPTKPDNAKYLAALKEQQDRERDMWSITPSLHKT